MDSIRVVHRTRIKICGITRPEDAAAAAAAGADAIGMVFYAPAPRNISIERAKEILSILPPFVSPVGLFVDADASAIRSLTSQLHLRHVQLHGHEPPARVAELAGLYVIKAVRVDDTFEQTLSTWRRASMELSLTNFRGVVLETAGTREAGGTGLANDWATVQRHRDAGAFEGLPRVIAAGGLTPQTVGDVVRSVRPWAVDVSSGVESAKGLKSVEKIQAFVRAVRKADEELNARE
jgi:phosphoribosylanthranilate isomerase